MYKNYYASGYTAGATVVTMDGYLDPTKRENTIITGNLVNEIQMGSAIHTILVGAEMIDTTNNNHRYNTFGLQLQMIMRFLIFQDQWISQLIQLVLRQVMILLQI